MVHNVAKGSMDDYNNNVRVIDVEVVIKEDDVVVKWMCITYDDKEERKEVITRTTHVKEGKDAPRWWDVQLKRGSCIANISISHLKEKDWIIGRSNRFLDAYRRMHRFGGGGCHVANGTRWETIAIESAHCGCERNSCKDWAWSKMCGKHGRI